MYIKKIILIVFLLIIIRILTIKKSTFQSTVQSNDEDIKLLVNTSDYNNINIQDAQIKLDPDYNSTYNIDIGNDIIAENNIKINGKNINIERIRYMKKFPIHYQDEICLSDNKGVECIKKEHIDVIKGALPLNIITYPDNRRKCFSASTPKIKPNWRTNSHTHHIYTSSNCSNGDINQEYLIKRKSPNTHSDDSHYHIHGIDSDEHEFHEDPQVQTLPVVNNYNINSTITDST
jgi:hypothetical protein